MKITQSAIGAALLGAVLAGTVWAEGPQQAASVRRAAFDYHNLAYLAEEDRASESVSEASLPDAAPPCCETACCEPSCCEPSCCSEPCCCSSRWCCCGTIAGDPWELPEPCALKCLGIEWGGWISAGIFSNAHGAAGMRVEWFRDDDARISFNGPAEVVKGLQQPLPVQAAQSSSLARTVCTSPTGNLHT